MDNTSVDLDRRYPHVKEEDRAPLHALRAEIEEQGGVIFTHLPFGPYTVVGEQQIKLNQKGIRGPRSTSGGFIGPAPDFLQVGIIDVVEYVDQYMESYNSFEADHTETDNHTNIYLAQGRAKTAGAAIGTLGAELQLTQEAYDNWRAKINVMGGRALSLF